MDGSDVPERWEGGPNIELKPLMRMCTLIVSSFVSNIQNEWIHITEIFVIGME